MSTKLKICGLLDQKDVTTVNEVLPDYVGFVFAKSSRMISEEGAKALKAALHPAILAVGVFVNEDMKKIIHLCQSQIIDIIQLHGDEDADYINSLKKELPNKIIKAIRVRGTEDIIRAESYSSNYLLLDAYKENEYGGSGIHFDWTLIPKLKKPFFLAGGINGNNVLKALIGYQPYCIDVSSGVETEGRKDLNKMKDLIDKIRSVR